MSTVETPFVLSASAVARVAALLAVDPTHKALRVAVLSGGCNGFQYQFTLEPHPTREEGDHLIQQDGAVVVVDPGSLDLLRGAELHYTENLMGASFTVRNPNARSACGCGVSFSVE
jgi:iron-sulfur cluster insertion protein